MTDGFGHEKPGEGLTNDWITPRWLLDALGAPDAFDLDPCASNNQPWPTAKRDYRLGRGEDGLLLPWEGRIWCNPPYGPHTKHWIQKCAHHRDSIMLIFARVETGAWWEIWTSAHAILFLKGRVSFNLPDGGKAKSGTAPSALIAFGEAAAKHLEQAEIAGAFIFEGWSCSDGKQESTLSCEDSLDGNCSIIQQMRGDSDGKQNR